MASSNSTAPIKVWIFGTNFDIITLRLLRICTNAHTLSDARSVYVGPMNESNILTNYKAQNLSIRQIRYRHLHEIAMEKVDVVRCTKMCIYFYMDTLLTLFRNRSTGSNKPRVCCLLLCALSTDIFTFYKDTICTTTNNVYHILKLP